MSSPNIRPSLENSTGFALRISACALSSFVAVPSAAPHLLGREQSGRGSLPGRVLEDVHGVRATLLASRRRRGGGLSVGGATMFRRRKGRVDENETASVSATGSGRASQDSAERRDGGTTQGASSKKHPRPDIDQEAQDDLQDLLKDLHGDEGDAGEDDIQSLMKELKLMRDEHEHVELERQLKRQLSEGEELRREIMSLPDQSEELVMELGLASMVISTSSPLQQISDFCDALGAPVFLQAEAEVSAESIEGARTRMETLKRAAVQAKSAGQQELARQNLRKMKEAKAM
eukprot:scaffold1535_cov382-Prasinococcus_capsulatus_cf.AAC.60